MAEAKTSTKPQDAPTAAQDPRSRPRPAPGRPGSGEHPEPPRRRYRIMCFDGGPTGAAYLRKLELLTQQPQLAGILARTDMFAGTSFGSFVALYLASRTEEQLLDGRRTLKRLLELTNTLYARFGLPHRIRKAAKQLTVFATGLGPLVDMQAVEDFLRQEGVFTRDGKELCIRDLTRQVAVVAFDLHSGTWGERDPLWRPWGARVFHNLLPDSADPECYPDWKAAEFREFSFGSWPTDHDLPLYEVMMRSGSFPALIPLRAGYADGAVFANNPSMAVLSTVLSCRAWINEQYNHDNEGNAVPRGWITGPDDLVFMSFGGDDPVFTQGKLAHAVRSASTPDDADSHWNRWGYPQWLLSPADPLLALKLLLNGDGRGVSYQVANVVPPGAFVRVSAPVAGGIVRTFIKTLLGFRSAIEKAAQAAERWAAVADPHLGLLDHLGEFPALPAQVGRPVHGEPEEKFELPEGWVAAMGLLREIDRLADRVVDERGEETGFTSQRIADAVAELLPLLAERFATDPVLQQFDRSALSPDDINLLLAEVRRAFYRGGADSPDLEDPEDDHPSYLLVSLWLRMVWLTPDDDELRPEDLERYRLTGSLWRVLTDPFYQLHWMKLLPSQVVGDL